MYRVYLYNIAVLFSPTQGGVDFTSDGKFMALAERRDCKDHISLFDCSQWQLVRHFPVETVDLVGLRWSPDSTVLCVWDSLLDYKVLLYSLDGRRLAIYAAYEHALGVKCVAWSPSSQFLAVGSFDQKLRVLNHVTWKTVAEHLHPQTLEGGVAVVYAEVESKRERPKPAPSSSSASASNPTTTAAVTGSTSAELLSSLRASAASRVEGGSFFASQSRYETQEPPVSIPSVKPDPEKPNPKLGIGTVLFSPDSRYVATRNDNMSAAVWVWDVAKLRLAALLLQTLPVREAKWDPRQARLAVCTGNNKLYLWSPAGCVSATVPGEANFAVQRLAWNPDGKSLALVGSSHFCVCYTEDSAS